MVSVEPQASKLSRGVGGGTHVDRRVGCSGKLQSNQKRHWQCDPQRDTAQAHHVAPAELLTDQEGERQIQKIVTPAVAGQQNLDLLEARQGDLQQGNQGTDNGQDQADFERCRTTRPQAMIKGDKVSPDHERIADEEDVLAELGRHPLAERPFEDREQIDGEDESDDQPSGARPAARASRSRPRSARSIL